MPAQRHVPKHAAKKPGEPAAGGRTTSGQAGSAQAPSGQAGSGQPGSGQTDTGQAGTSQAVGDQAPGGKAVSGRAAEAKASEATASPAGGAHAAGPDGANGRAAKVDVLQSRPVRFEGLRLWLRRPSGRTVVTGAVLAVVLGGAYAAGQYLVPAVSEPRAGTSVAPPPTATPGAVETGEAPVPQPPTTTFSPPVGAQERPSDVLAAWAGPRAVKLSVPVVSMQAYGYAELITSRTTPGCKLTWTTLAGIAKVESDHGRINGALVQDDGKSVPSIIGPPLDGQSNRRSIKDTDGGAIDTDKTWDRAVGPMQFLPSTWKQFGVDADADGVTDINDIDDAALTAAAYLCADGRDLSTSEGWNAAIASYNMPDDYRTAVFNATNDYGRRDRSG